MEFEKIKKIISEVLNVDAEEITMDTTFVDDLGADSLDIFQIIMGLEEEFDIEIAIQLIGWDRDLHAAHFAELIVVLVYIQNQAAAHWHGVGIDGNGFGSSVITVCGFHGVALICQTVA